MTTEWGPSVRDWGTGFCWALVLGGGLTSVALVVLLVWWAAR